MDLNARVDVNCGRKDELTDGRKTGRLYRILLTGATKTVKDIFKKLGIDVNHHQTMCRD